MTTNKLETSEEIGITLPYVIKIIKEIFPEGYDYANRVGELAHNLHESVDSFSAGVLTQDYGWYPFLIVKEVHYEEACVCEDSIVLKSKFDMETFNEWMDSLSISSKIRDMIKSEVHIYYDNFHQSNFGNLDMTYIEVMKHLIQTFNCLRRTYDNAHKELGMIFKMHVGMYRHVSLTCAFTLPYLMKKVKRFNQKEGAASGRYLIVLKDGPSDGQVRVNCEKYNKK